VLLAYSYIIWRKGFTPEDRVLFKRRKADGGTAA